MKYILFDWGRTIYDKDNGVMYEGVVEAIKELHKRYKIAIVSIADDDGIESRFALIDKFGLRPYIAFALFHKTDKDSLIRNALCNLQADPKDTIVIDDRVKRLVYPASIGCQTIWISHGKYAHETPEHYSINVTHTVGGIGECVKMLEFS